MIQRAPVLHRAVLLTLGWLLVAAAPAMAQTSTAFFQVFRGRITGNATVQVRAGDLVAAIVDNAVTTTSVDATGAFDNLTITRTSNTAAQIRFELRRGNARFQLVGSAGDTQDFTVAFAGQSNPLSAAFNAQTINMFVGATLAGGGNGDGDGDGDGGGDDVAGGSPDVDGNGVVELQDARLIMRFIMGWRDVVEQPVTLDATGDGRVNTEDVVEVLRRLGEVIETTPPAEEDNAGGA